jgi:phosphatidylinositol kinase/protein kinase (PI-3  family)
VQLLSTLTIAAVGCGRDNKDPLLSVIEPFIRDPTVAWGRGGRAQRGGDDTTGRGRRQQQLEQQFEDIENVNAGIMLKDISARLDG